MKGDWGLALCGVLLGGMVGFAVGVVGQDTDITKRAACAFLDAPQRALPAAVDSRPPQLACDQSNVPMQAATPYGKGHNAALPQNPVDGSAPEPSSSSFDQWQALSEKSNEQQIKLAALEELGSVGDIDGLARLLGDTDVVIREAVVEKLLWSGEGQAVQVLGQVLIADDSVQVRLKAAAALESLRHEPAAAYFLEYARFSDPSAKVRALAAQSLR